VNKFLTGFIAVFVSIFPPLPQERQAISDETRLAKILASAGDYCEKLKNMALNFVCHENIKEKTYEFGKGWIFKFSKERGRGFVALEDLRTIKTIKTSFIYDYQLIKKGEDIAEKRDLLEENGKKRVKRDVELQVGRMSGKYIVFGPVGFLSRSWQPHFQYEILGEETLGPTKAVIIRASPRALTDENYCFGRIWVEETGADILQIEWEPRSIVNFRETVESPIGVLKRKIAWTVRYDIIKNGVRFPGRQSIKETFLTPNGKEHPKYEAEYVYDRYRFFTVETEVVVK
jgi:hypothetical protein